MKAYCLNQADSCKESFNRICQAVRGAKTHPILSCEWLTTVQASVHMTNTKIQKGI